MRNAASPSRNDSTTSGHRRRMAPDSPREHGRAQQWSFLPRLCLALALFAVVTGRWWYLHNYTKALSAHLFQVYDSDRTRRLNMQELRSYLKDHGVSLSKEQAQLWLGGLDDEADGFDEEETTEALELFDELPSASDSLRHLTEERSMAWDLVFMVVIAFGLTYLVLNESTLASMLESYPMMTAFRMHRMQNTMRRLRREAQELQSDKAKLESRMRLAASTEGREISPPSPVSGSVFETIGSNPSSGGGDGHSVVDGHLELGGSERQQEAEPEEERHRAAEVARGHELQLEEIAQRQRGQDEELQRWRREAQKHMSEAAVLNRRMESIQTWLRGIRGVIRGCGQAQFREEGAEEGFSCAPEDAEFSVGQGFALERFVFGTVDLDGLYEVNLSKDQVTDGTYRCRHTSTGERFFVKIYDCLEDEDWGNTRRQILSDLAAKRRLPFHKNIVRYERVIESEDKVFVLMELVEGQDLWRVIEERRFGLDEEEARLVFGQVCEAVRFLHSPQVGVIHGDIKPDNIQILEAGQVVGQHGRIGMGRPVSSRHQRVEVKLVDFGLSSFQGEGARAPIKDDFLAPEDLSAQTRQTRKTDVWRIGASLYASVTRNLPFTKDVFIDRKWRKAIDTNRLRSGDFSRESPWDELSEELRDLIQQMLTVDPDRRPEVDDVLRHPWFIRPPTPVQLPATPNSSQLPAFSGSDRAPHFSEGDLAGGRKQGVIRS